MADREAERELVHCHACANEWYKDDGGLECPSCHSGAVEVLEHNNDPRDDHIDLTNDSNDGVEELGRNADALPQHPLHQHNPWANELPDPDEGDIEHFTFNPLPGVHIQQTTFRTTPQQRQNPQDAFAPIFSTFAGMFNNGSAPPTGFGDPRSPFPAPGQQPIFPNHNNPQGNPRVRANIHVFGAGEQANGVNGINAVLQTVLATLQQSNPRANNGPHAQNRGQPENPFDILMQTLTQLRDPGRAAHGDAVFTDEALDRIISQMMEQQAGASSAPGPATAAAIAALPKKQADKEMVGADGKAECSVCMDAVLLGDEVTVLPCKHWFHGDCVGAWLKEHDTCPHCRQGIMPKDAPADATSPRSPGQPPRHNQNQDQNHVRWGFGATNNVNNNPPRTPPTPTANQILTAAQQMAAAQPQPLNQQPIVQGRPIQPFHNGAWTQPGMQHPYMPGGYAAYPEPRDYVQPPGAAPALSPSSSSQRTPPSPGEPGLRRRGSTERGSSGGENGNGSGEGSSRLSGWWRNLRSGSSAEGR